MLPREIAMQSLELLRITWISFDFQLKSNRIQPKSNQSNRIQPKSSQIESKSSQNRIQIKPKSNPKSKSKSNQNLNQNLGNPMKSYKKIKEILGSPDRNPK